MRVVAVSAWTGTDSLDVMEDRGSAVFASREEAEKYLASRDFDASITIVPLENV